MQTKYWSCIVLLMATLGGHAQSGGVDYSTVRVSDWVTQRSDTLDYALREFGGKRAFILIRKFANSKSASLAYPKELDFTNGSIELDIASPNGKQGFVGIAFHIQDSNHYETLYFRPGSSGTGEAIQYMPKKKPEFDWWDLSLTDLDPGLSHGSVGFWLGNYPSGAYKNLKI